MGYLTDSDDSVLTDSDVGYLTDSDDSVLTDSDDSVRRSFVVIVGYSVFIRYCFNSFDGFPFDGFQFVRWISIRSMDFNSFDGTAVDDDLLTSFLQYHAFTLQGIHE